MSWKKALAAFSVCVTVLFAAPTLQAQAGYLDVYIAKLKPEKAAEAEAIAKKITDANRHNNGDRVLVEQPVFGDPYTLIFVTQRESYADVDKGNDAFMASVNKAFGKDSKTFVATMGDHDFRANEKSVTLPADDTLKMSGDFADLWERAAVDGTPVRAIVGENPVEFAEAFAQAYARREWFDKERARLTKAIEDAERGEQK